MKQDRNGVRTAQDLERKYKSKIAGKAEKLNTEGIKKVEKTLENFIDATLKNFEEVHEEIDANISYDVSIESSNGVIFKNGLIDSVLTAKVRKGNEDITEQFTDTQFSWTRVSKDPEGDAIFNETHKHMKSIKITKNDIYVKAVFFVVLTF